MSEPVVERAIAQCEQHYLDGANQIEGWSLDDALHSLAGHVTDSDHSVCLIAYAAGRVKGLLP